MGNILDKPAVLDRIKEHYSLKGNADLARFLGVAPNTITNWYSRSTFDIDAIYTKCEGISFDWLFTGRGEMVLKDQSLMPASQPADDSLLYNMYKEEKAENKALIKEIGALEQQVKTLEKQLEDLGFGEIKKQEASVGSTRTRKSGVAELGDARFADQSGFVEVK